jgi:arsenate reductase
MAEAFLRKYAGQTFEVYSAGIEPKGLNPYTLQAMEEIGVDMSGHTSKALTQFMGRVDFGYLITVCSRAEEKCPIFPGMGIRLHWPFDDPADFEGPAEEKLARFRLARDQIKEQVLDWLAEQGIDPEG